MLQRQLAYTINNDMIPSLIKEVSKRAIYMPIMPS